MKNRFGKNLKNLRRIGNMSQKDVANRLNVSFKTISHWESGYSEPSIDMLIQMKEIFDISYDDLIE